MVNSPSSTKCSPRTVLVTGKQLRTSQDEIRTASTSSTFATGSIRLDGITNLLVQNFPLTSLPARSVAIWKHSNVSPDTIRSSERSNLRTRSNQPSGKSTYWSCPKRESTIRKARPSEEACKASATKGSNECEPESTT